MTTRIHPALLVIICIAIPLVVGIVSSLLTRNAMVAFETMKKPPLAPPGWLFPVAWTILYVLMGLASYFIITSNTGNVKLAIVIYAVQLAFNFFWSLFFFNGKMYAFSFVWLLAMLVMVIILIVLSAKISKAAMFMLIPYAAWCTFAAYLNLGIGILN